MPEIFQNGHGEKLERTISPLSYGDPIDLALASTSVKEPRRSILDERIGNEGDIGSRRIRAECQIERCVAER
jgi:energy-coupling factor transporter ATP-binding protein EcfA2